MTEGTLNAIPSGKPIYTEIEPFQSDVTRLAKESKANSKRRKTTVNNDMWTLTIAGFYGGKANGQYAEKPYKVVITMPDKQVVKGALSQFVKNYAPHLMPKLFYDYQNLFTFEIVDAICNNEEKQAYNITVMSRASLIDFINDNELPIDLELYVDSADLRQAISECTSTNPKTADAFLMHQTQRKERMGDKMTDATAALSFIEESLANSRLLQKKAFAQTTDDL